MNSLRIFSSFRWILLLALFVVWGCNENDYNDLAPPPSKIEGISGSWTIQKVEQVELTKRPGGFDIRYDVSDIMIGDNPMSIVFDSEGNLRYTVNAGSTVHNLGASGIWSFDDAQFPTRISFTSDEGNTVFAELKRTVRPVDNVLQFEFARECRNVENPEFGYEYTFNRDNQ